MRPYVRAAAGLRSLALFAALAMLLGAARTRFASARRAECASEKQKGPESPGPF